MLIFGADPNSILENIDQRENVRKSNATFKVGLILSIALFAFDLGNLFVRDYFSVVIKSIFLVPIVVATIYARKVPFEPWTNWTIAGFDGLLLFS